MEQERERSERTLREILREVRNEAMLERERDREGWERVRGMWEGGTMTERQRGTERAVKDEERVVGAENQAWKKDARDWLKDQKGPWANIPKRRVVSN